MRLIDADLLRKEFPMPEDMRDPKQCLYHVTGIWAEIDAAPTVEERKEGYWHNRYVESMGMVAMTCSECGCPCGQIPMKYCANCGAKMMNSEVVG